MLSLQRSSQNCDGIGAEKLKNKGCKFWDMSGKNSRYKFKHEEYQSINCDDYGGFIPILMVVIFCGWKQNQHGTDDSDKKSGIG